MRGKFILSVCALLSAGLVLWPAAVSAQGDAKQKFQQAQKQNGAAQRRYTWMSRTELLLKGESKNVKVESVFYNNQGQLEKTVVESTPQQDPGGGRLKQRIVEKKKAEFQELMEGLGGLAQSYAHLSPEQMQALMQSASISQGQGEMQGTMRIQGTNVVVQGDTMTLWVDPQTFLFRQVQIDSLYEKKPMKLSVEFQDIPNGPTVSARTTLDYPDKKVQVLIENSDYKSLQPAAAAGSAQGGAGAPGQAAALDPAALDKLLAPVALYPDALLGQILMCSMSPFQVGELGKWLQANSTVKGSAVQDAVQKEGFDPSFVALSSFPDVVHMMAGQLDWTRHLGQAFGSDRSAVMASIQRLRAQAMQVGSLKDTPQQDVQTQTTQSGQQVIVIQPANPQVIYVPQYNPQTVYVTSPPQTTTVVVQESSSSSAAGAAVVGFTAGIIIGAAANNSYWGPYGMYNEAWDDFYDHREDMYEQYSENRENIAQERTERQGTRQEERTERQGGRQENQTERQTGRQENQTERQGTRDDRQTGRQTDQASRQEGRQTDQASRQEGRQQQQGSRQESFGSGSRGHAQGGGQAAQDRSGTRSGAFSGYESGSRTRQSSSRGQRSASSSRGSRSGGSRSGGGRRR